MPGIIEICYAVFVCLIFLAVCSFLKGTLWGRGMAGKGTGHVEGQEAAAGKNNFLKVQLLPLY